MRRVDEKRRVRESTYLTKSMHLLTFYLSDYESTKFNHSHHKSVRIHKLL